MIYQDISIVRAKAQIRKRDGVNIVICTVKELSTPVTMTRKQWNNWTESLPTEDGAGICGSVIFYDVGEPIYPYNGEVCTTKNRIIKDFALVTGSKGMQQVALVNASIAVMSRFGAASVNTPASFKPENWLKVISGKNAGEWETILLDEDLTRAQGALVMKLAEERTDANIPF